MASRATTTEAIARRVGVSQPYLFRLFPSKKAIFLAAIDDCFDRLERLFETAAEGLTGEDALIAMGRAYNALLDDRPILQMQLQMWATACHDDEVRALARRRMAALWQQVARHLGRRRPADHAVHGQRDAAQRLRGDGPAADQGTAGRGADRASSDPAASLTNPQPRARADVCARKLVANHYFGGSGDEHGRSGPSWSPASRCSWSSMDNLDRHQRAARHPDRARHRAGGSGVDRQRVHADLRRVPADRRRARRPVRPAPAARPSDWRSSRSPRPPPRWRRTSGTLIAARAVQGLGGAIVMPLTLTLLGQRHRPERRGLALRHLGRHGGPRRRRSARSSAAPSPSTPPGSGSSGSTYRSACSCCRVIALARGRAAAAPAGSTRSASCWPPPGCSASSSAWSAATVTAGPARQVLAGLDRRRPAGARLRGLAGPGAAPDGAAGAVPPSRGFSVVNAVAFVMAFGMFGAVFLGAQYLQSVLGYSPFEAGLRTLPWTAVPALAAPFAGLLVDRIGARPSRSRSRWRCRRPASAWLAAGVDDQTRPYGRARRRRSCWPGWAWGCSSPRWRG